MRSWITLSILTLHWLIISSSLQSAEKSIWPQWRGPNRNAKIEGEPWPKRLKKNNVKQLWRVELQPSYSGSIVSEDLVFVTETTDKKQEVVKALNRKTGKQVWEAKWDGAMSVPFFARANGSWIRATPAYDGKYLYVAGMRDLLVCLDAKTGKEVWKVDFKERYKTPLPSFGFVSSPLVTEDAVYVQAGASFLKLNKKTGKSIWRTLNDGGGMLGSAFSSPYMTNLAGLSQLLVQTRTNLAGVDPKSGKVLWSEKIPAFRGMNILTPTVYRDQVFTSAYGGKAHLFQVQQKDGTLQAIEAWNARIQAYMSSPIILDGHAYLHLKNQRVSCIDLETGNECWRSKKSFGKYWSMVAKDGRILALDERGMLYLIDANPKKLTIIDELSISDQPTWAHLAVCGNEIFIRELRAMTVYRWNEEKE